MSFSTLPAGSSDTITPFQIQTPPEVLEELKLLVKYSRIAVPTYENTQKDGKYGIDREWMVNIQKKWLEFDW